MLRTRPDGSVPAGNPFGTPVYSYGHRNVQGLAFGPDGTVYASELDLNDWDELNALRAGANYGWPEAEGTRGSGGVPPIFQRRPEEASPSGIAYARGAIWMASLRGQRLWRLPVARGRRAGRPRAYLVGRYGRLRTVERAVDGALWVDYIQHGPVDARRNEAAARRRPDPPHRAALSGPHGRVGDRCLRPAGHRGHARSGSPRGGHPSGR